MIEDCEGNRLRVCGSRDLESLVRFAWRERSDVTLRYRLKTPHAAVNETCPWSGKPVSADAVTEFEGRTVGFCSVAHRDRFVGVLDAAAAPQGADRPAVNAYCPWSNRPALRDAIVRLPSGSVGFCSRAHHDRFLLAVKYFREIVRRLDVDGSPPAQTWPRDAVGGHVHAHGQAASGATPAPAAPGSINRTCPWTGAPVSADALTGFEGHVVGFHEAADRDAFQAAAQIAGAYTPARGGEPSHRHAANTTCPISGNPARADVTAMVGTRRVAFCSTAHRDAYLAAAEHFRACCKPREKPCDAHLVRLTLDC